jgi:hypothetical protein
MINTNIAENNYSEDDQAYLLSFNWLHAIPPFPLSLFEFLLSEYTDKKAIQIILIYREIQSGAVAKPYMTNGLLIYGEIFAHFLIY